MLLQCDEYQENWDNEALEIQVQDEKAYAEYAAYLYEIDSDAWLTWLFHNVN